MPLKNTDYNKQFLDLYDLLPDVHRSDVNRSLFNNLFNRFLTKQEVDKVAGYIGDPNKNAILRRQIEEPTLHRQAYQLQPILNAVIGSTRHFSSWEDIRQELSRLGVDLDRMDEWGSVQVFNWAPPIDIDKIVNYQTYYWMGGLNTNPEYITVRSRCSVAMSKVHFWERIVDEYGAENAIVDVPPYIDETEFPAYNIIELYGPDNQITLEGDVTEYLADNDFFYVYGTINNNGKHRIGTITFDRLTSVTTIEVIPGTINTGTIEAAGSIKARFFDTVSIDGNLAGLFTDDFVFFIKDSANVELNFSFWKAVSSEFDEATNQTKIKLNTIFTDEDDTGVISLNEQLELAVAEQFCYCGDSGPWDLGQWDDNPNNPIWGGIEPGDHANWLTDVTEPTAPPVNLPPGHLPQWYAENEDILYQWDDSNSVWVKTTSNFSFVLEQTKGNNYWDFVKGCNTTTALESAEQWIESNQWLHQSDVEDFTLAKKAQAPIIEYQWDIQLNEWSYTSYKWQYRGGSIANWADTDQVPNLLELTPIRIWEEGISQNIIEVDERYGDLTNIFQEGYVFAALETDETYTVVDSYYSRNQEGGHFTTKITIDEIISNTSLIEGDLAAGTESLTPLSVHVSSLGDRWENYGSHWLFVEARDPVAVSRVPKNLLIDAPEDAIYIDDPSGDFNYYLTPFAQIMNMTVDDYSEDILLIENVTIDSTRTLRRRALVGQNSVRVYVNGIHQYGNYDEIEELDGGIEYVKGIRFLDSVRLNLADQIRIEVGEPAQHEIGLYSLPVRVYESNNEYKSKGDVNMSLTSYSKTEQNKSTVNQYPLFDIFHLDGSFAFQANSIFSFHTDPDYPINNSIGGRVVYYPETKVYEFEQHLIEEDNGEMYAYRDFSNLKNHYWFNPAVNKLFFWTDGTWSNKILMGDYYREAVVSSDEPGFVEKNIDGLFWYDTGNQELKVRDVYNQTWTDVDDVMVSFNDHTLQTIWRKGTNDEKYVPEKVDWDRRNEEEYNTERESFTTYTTKLLLSEDPELTEIEAAAQALAMWYRRESNIHSPGGLWVGDWELLDPLYYNHSHENKKVVDLSELRVHFNTIIDGQERIPGYTDDISGMFHLIPINEINYGVGGTIHEYNDGFDTFLSSAFVKNVTPISLIDFAGSQYDILLINSIIEAYRENIIDFLTATTEEAKNNIEAYVVDSVIENHWENDYYSWIYGDSSTYNEETGEGMRNWIATLPYVNLLVASEPVKLVDPTLGISELKHHDGHTRSYSLSDAETDALINSLINTEDLRAGNDTWGRSSLLLPPNNMVEFESNFNTTIDKREGVYWYWTPSFSVRKLYRMNVVKSAATLPLGDYDEGSLWFDTSNGNEVLKIKKTNTVGYAVWDVVDGLVVGDGRLHNGLDPNDLRTATVSAWQEVDIGELMVDTLLEVEQKLYDNAPNEPLRYDIEETRNINPALFDEYLEDAFLDYISEYELVDPFANLDYEIDDPWTWNYGLSVPGGGHEIVFSDDATNEFHIQGNHESVFDPCYYEGFCPSQVSFYIKNSTVNDGTWLTAFSNGLAPIARYDSNEDITIIKVEGTVAPSIEGVIYQGDLPGSINTGEESGGYWKDYYNELYGTPYPHIEPWKLQGYQNKPDWWDEEYLNDNLFDWGSRTWKYKHGMDIVDLGNRTSDGYIITNGNFLEKFVPDESFEVDRSDGANDKFFTVGKSHNIEDVDPAFMYVEVDGDQDAIYTPGLIISIFSNANAFLGTYVIDYSQYQGPPTMRTRIYLTEELSSSVDLNSQICGIYDPSLNQQTIFVTELVTIPGSPAANGRIKKAFGMWTNVLQGTIPAGKKYPNGIQGVTGDPTTDRGLGVDVSDLNTWNYVSVNIDDDPHSADAGTTTYRADDLLPPYWDHFAAFDNAVIPSFDIAIRSVFFNYGSEIISPGADYIFGDGGPVEWDWKSSARYLYDQYKAAYRIDPVRYVSQTFGIDFYNIGGLQLDPNTNNTFCHCRTNFHGDIIDDEALSFDGTNQWYVNFNRYTGFDNNFSDFANLWKGWTAPLTYQFATFVDTQSFQIGHRSIPFSKFDYQLDMKRSNGVDDFWMDAFKVALVEIPPALVRYSTQNEWLLEVNTHLSISRKVNVYDVQNYQFYPDVSTNTCKLFTWKVMSTDVYNRIFEIPGNQTTFVKTSGQFTITESYGNDGVYTIAHVVFNPVTNRTIIEVAETIPSIRADGKLTLNDFRTLPWETGEMIYINSTETLPAPLIGETEIGLTQNFLIKVSDNEFKIANTKTEALSGNEIDLTSVGRGDQFVGKVHSSFQALDGRRSPEKWIHYELDKTRILEISLPEQIRGIQNFINFVDGYDTYTRDEGWRVNDESLDVDQFLGRPISWQLEVERFIDYAYGVRSVKYKQDDRYEVSLDISANEFSFTGPNPNFRTGDKIIILSSNGVYPDPIFRYSLYYYMYIDGQRFKISATKRGAESGEWIDILSDNGVEELYISKPKTRRDQFPRVGINPFRSGLWFRPPRGVVSNIVTGPTEDIRTVQTIIDQYGRRFEATDVRVNREDKRSQISIRSNIPNVVNPPVYSFYPSHEDYLHIGGIHLFFDTYEHVLVFNNYTTDGDLVYDPFVGLNATKFEMLFNRQPEFTHRPNVGGYYYSNENNIDPKLLPNVENGVESLRYAYDTFNVIESNKITREVRKSIGYQGMQDYLSKLNVNEKSQFLFWRGFIQHKGSVNSVSAFLQSRRFVDAKMDEFWAVRLAEFGSSRDKEYPEMYVLTDDVTSNDSRFEFLEVDEIIPDNVPGGDAGGGKYCNMVRVASVLPSEEGKVSFIVPFESEIGTLTVFVQGTKLSESQFNQLSEDEIELMSGLISDEDVIEVETWLVSDLTEVEKVSQEFTNVGGETTLTTNFTCPIGNMAVWVNGTKLTEHDYTQTGLNTFDFTTMVLSETDVVEVESWKPAVNADFTITRRAKAIAPILNQFEFATDIPAPVVCGNDIITVFVNGKKLTTLDYTQTSEETFILEDRILSTSDVIEVEYWILEKNN